MKHYPWLDVLKYLCSIGIVSIHTQPFVDCTGINQHYLNFQNLYVPLFFVISSALFWHKIQWNQQDMSHLLHFTRRLMLLVLLWGILLLPHWLSKFIRHNPDDWLLLLLPKVALTGFAQGSWFILSLIYGVWLCYGLNRYLPRTLVFSISMAIWAYFSLVHYEGMSDYLSIYYPNSTEGFQFESYFSIVRSFVWIEAGYYLLPIVRDKCSVLYLKGLLFLSLIGLCFLPAGYFVPMGIAAIILPALCMKVTNDQPKPRLVLLRRISILVFFIHFPIVTAFHTLYLAHLRSQDFGMCEFLVTIILSTLIAYLLIYWARRFKPLSYLY